MANYAPSGFDRKTLVKENNLFYRLFLRGGRTILAVCQTLMRRQIALAEYSSANVAFDSRYSCPTPAHDNCKTLIAEANPCLNGVLAF